jgi:hypothetical protein
MNMQIREVTIPIVPLLAAMAACTPAEGSSGPGGGSGGSAVGAGGVPTGAGGLVAPTASGGLLLAAGGSSVTPPEACATAAYESTLLPSSILFLVDRSGSMNCNLPPITTSAACEATATRADTSQPSKWTVITSTLSAALDELATVPNTSVGLAFFSTNDECGSTAAPSVGVSPLAAPQVSALKGALAGATPAGGTPIIGSMILGFQHLHQTLQAPGNRFIVLVTDGADSCADQYAAAGVTGDVQARLLDVELPKAISVNIRSFVIGAPGSEAARGLLSKIAFAGGTPSGEACDHTSADPAPGAGCHLDMTQSTDLASDLATALRGITGQAAMTCEFAVPQGEAGQALDPTAINVDYFVAGNNADPSAKVELGLVPDNAAPCPGGVNGWQYNDDRTKIRLCSEVCDRVLSDLSAQIVVSVGCEQRIIR